MLIALLSVLCICCCSVCNANGIPADRIIKNAKIFTADKEKPLGERRATNMYRCKTLWDSGALVAWSSDNTIFMDFSAWNPYLGMEVGMTRWTTEKTNAPEMSRTIRAFPPESEKMSIDEMLLGYTINGAIQLGIEDSKGSITVGKDADFLVFDNDLLTAEHEGFSYTKPTEVVFGGKKVK